VQEILVNVVGTEDFVIYAIDPQSDEIVAISGMGPSFVAARRAESPEQLFDVVRAGRIIIGRHHRSALPVEVAADVDALVPLNILERPVGAIVIASLLPHRDALNECDEEVLRMLGAYAATAIIAADERAQWDALPLGV
jgi:hypothetical protein